MIDFEQERECVPSSSQRTRERGARHNQKQRMTSKKDKV